MAEVLLVGSGGREHALAVFLARSSQVERVVTWPGNAGTPNNLAMDVTGKDNFEALADYAEQNRIDLTVVGPEAFLCAGIVNTFKRRGLLIFGPTEEAARLEGDKAFARSFMKKHGIPHPDFSVFFEHDEAKEYLLSHQEGRIVVKASGLAGGKGSLVCESIQQALEAVESMMSRKQFGSAGDKVVIEEYMEGEEASILILCDGRKALYLASSQDHKQIYDGDRGPNTGGMGAYAPAPVVTENILKRVDEDIVQPTLRGMSEEGFPYQGCLYVGLMISKGEPRVVEYNCRFGDPETQAVLPLLRSDLFELLYAASEGDLRDIEIACHPGSACCVIMVSEGYPGKYENGKVIKGLNKLESIDGLYAFHAGTTINERGEIISSGGRVLGVTAMDATIEEAVKKAYLGVEKVQFANRYFRRDIGHRAMGRTQ